MKDLLRRLADIEPGDLPFLSIYLDVRPEATGEKPETRNGLVVLRKRLNVIRQTYLPRGDGLDSLDRDIERINAFVENDLAPQTEGLAIFACAGRGVFETRQFAIPFENQVSAGPGADLYQLVRSQDEHEVAVVAVVDTNTARFFVQSRARFDEVPAPDEEPINFQLRSTGGWSEARYQRHIKKHRQQFAKETAAALADLVDRVHAHHVVLAGDQIAITTLQEELSAAVKDKTRHIARIGIRANRDEIAAEVAPILERVENESGQTVVDHLVEQVRRGGLGVAGIEETLDALAAGQVRTLVIDEQAGVPEDKRAELVRRATATDAEVEVVSGAPEMREFSGVGALLRYLT
jgi:peptide chain release factor subunit 1